MDGQAVQVGDQVGVKPRLAAELVGWMGSSGIGNRPPVVRSVRLVGSVGALGAVGLAALAALLAVKVAAVGALGAAG